MKNVFSLVLFSLMMGITFTSHAQGFNFQGVPADNVTGVLSLKKWGTGVGSLSDLKTFFILI